MGNIWITSWRHSDIFCRGILVILGVLSVYSWYIIFEKLFIIRTAYVKNRYLGNLILSKKEIKRVPCPLYSIFDYLTTLIRYNKFSLEMSKSYIEKAFIKEQNNLEKNLTSLATITTVAPFLGLLGTVWGLLVSFINMSITGSSSIKVVASGVAEALITTVLGLMVAIPAAVGYNFLKEKIKVLMDEMEFFIPHIEQYLNEIFLRQNEKQK
ncbi:MAG: MotA/TolQ/ExbB proton channel family protein [Candidatus Omnitrophica bacterium]|nr:MotA/TolQ/ExbB proton channel family protein [Candidatus Omnitrophota bacterium]